MVAKISTGKDIIGLINYNEQKVEKGTAKLIGGENMVAGKPYDELSYHMKVGVFQEIIQGKQGRKLENNTFHASLNFDPSEKPSDQTLKEIANKYMEKMGYGDQPFLVYRHEDTGHPHIHIVSTRVDREGNKLNTDFYKLKSEKARKELEIEHNLIKASEKQKQSIDKIKAIEPTVAVYGQSETKAAINNVLVAVVKDYKVTSLKEFQAALQQFNIKAEHITGTSRKGEHEGMVYSITDDKGNRQGRGIKASSFYSKPTIGNLQKVFEENREAKRAVAKHTVKAIEKVFDAHESITTADFKKKLAAVGINVAYHEGKQGVFGITVIDNANKAVFKGSELGKEYSWNFLQHRFANSTVEKAPMMSQEEIRSVASTLATIYGKLKKDEKIGEFFESKFIRKLDRVDLLSPLMKLRTELKPEEGKVFVDSFKQYKRSKLEETESKEKDYFVKGVGVALRFLEQTPATHPESYGIKVAFLAKNNYKVVHGADRTLIVHSKGDHLQEAIDNSRARKLFGEPMQAGDTSKLTPYNKQQKAFISGIAEGKPELQELTLFNFNYYQFKPLLSESNQNLVARHLTDSYLKELNGVINRGASGREIAKELDKRGMQVVPLAKDGFIQNYALQYFRMPEGRLQVSPQLKDKLLNDGYNAAPTPITTKYSILSGLQQSHDRKDGGGIERALAAIEKINPLFSASLRKELMPTLEAARKGEGSFKEKMEQSAIGLLIERVSKYPTDNLKEKKLDAGLKVDMEDEEGKKKKSAGGNGDDGGVDSHHSRNRKRRRPSL